MKEQERDFSKLMDDASAFRQQVRMAAVQVSGLKPDELAQALAYEVEPFSGIPATEAEVLYKPIADPDPTVRVYDVSVKRRKHKGIGADTLDRWLKYAIAFACLTIAGLAADGIWLAYRQTSLKQAVGVQRTLQAKLDSLNGAIRTAQSEVHAIRSRREAALRSQNEVAALRTAHADILDELAAACREQAVVTSLTPTGETLAGLHVQAVSTSAENASDVMRRLTDRAEARGWRLVPDAITANVSGTTTSFTFDVIRK